MKKLFSSVSTPIEEFDSLALYHHATYAFEPRLQELVAILELPKEFKLAERFKKLESILNKTFRLELLHRLHFAEHQLEITNSEEKSVHQTHHPELLLHLCCLLGCTDSIGYIAQYLELTPEEVKELIRELHNTFSIDSMLSCVRQYYEQNKHKREIPELQKRSELLGVEPTLEPKETAEDRKQRLRRRYGHLANVFHLMCH